MVWPSGLMATLETLFVWPFSVLLTSPEARSHTLVVWEGFGGEISHRYKANSSKERLTALCCLCWSPHTDCRSRKQWSCHPG